MADEINRASPRTQSALLQSMQEYHVTIAGARHDLPSPFHVLATQNPLEQEGTYPLPEAQLDRFLMQIDILYPEIEAERRILHETTGVEDAKAENVLSAAAAEGNPAADPSHAGARNRWSRRSLRWCARRGPARAMPRPTSMSPGVRGRAPARR